MCAFGGVWGCVYVCVSAHAWTQASYKMYFLLWVMMKESQKILFSTQCFLNLVAPKKKKKNPLGEAIKYSSPGPRLPESRVGLDTQFFNHPSSS